MRRTVAARVDSLDRSRDRETEMMKNGEDADISSRRS
jgi:hypothetical protein